MQYQGIIMEEICRLCCSSDFVRNDIFEPGDDLHAKIALCMPLQVSLKTARRLSRPRTQYLARWRQTVESIQFVMQLVGRSVQVRCGDGLPRRVCDACRRRVIDMHRFCCEALRSQHR